jgi:heme A synthase
VKPKHNWRPRVIHKRMLLSLGLFLALVLIAVLILNAFSTRSQLSQRAFISEIDVSKFRLSFSTFAPISIAPTVISIIVGLWWDQLDSTFRMLQPFISMSRGPTPMNKGAGLTYRSKSWAGAAIKAGRNQHWVLLMITIGSVLAQVLTVSMSALFEQKTRSVAQQMTLPRDLEMRQVPLITQVDLKGDSTVTPSTKVLNNMYLDAAKNWLYGAAIQSSYNGSQLPWTMEGWSFLPVNLSSVSDLPNSGTSLNTSNTGTASVNVTISTPAVRARLNCRAVEETANASSWIEPKTLDNQGEIYSESEWAQINTTSKVNAYSLLDHIFNEKDSYSTMALKGAPSCCSNGTRIDPQRSIMGYWSPVLPQRDIKGEAKFPYEDMKWPMEITSTWLVGTAFNLSDGGNTPSSYLFYTDVPRLQAARCEPIIESTEATITLDKDTGNVVSYMLESAASSADVAWSDVFTQHESDLKTRMNTTSLQPTNITASYGVLFLDTLFGTTTKGNAFALIDQDNGLSMDLMTYSMYLLTEKNNEALLNYTTLATYADRTFQTFFQHFVNNGLSLQKGGFAYQPIGDSSMEALGAPLNNGRVVERQNFAVLNTSRTITASISHRIRVLHMNALATYLSAAILVWLTFTAIIVLCFQRKYTSFMNRDVELIADMLVLIAGSDNLLELVAEKGVELKKSREVMTMLGWFRDRDGHTRWGVEIVGGRNAVDWVDAPKQGFHVPIKASRSKIWAWKPWRTN